MKKPKLPATDSIEELARFWDTHDATDFEDDFEEVTKEVFVPKPVSMSAKTVLTTKSGKRTENKPKRALARTFSERHGYKPIRQALQLESMDGDLRNSLWNTFVEFYLSGYESLTREFEGSSQRILLRRIWGEFFKLPEDNLKDYFSSERDSVRNLYYQLEWYEVYDFLEFVAERGGKGEVFTERCNRILEREGSGYRFVKGCITPITAEAEISAIEEAAGTPYPNVNEHIRQSVALISDRKKPDYRNAIKESISAVEALARSISGRPKATLGQALGVLEKERGLHPALKSAFSSLYGYTSDEGGIRHALLEKSSLDFNEAKFMLVSCSAFVNFVIANNPREKHRER